MELFTELFVSVVSTDCYMWLFLQSFFNQIQKTRLGTAETERFRDFQTTTSVNYA